MMPEAAPWGRGRLMDWARIILAYVTGMVDQELLARNEYLAAENRILRAQLKGRLQLSDAERATLGEIGHRLGCTGGKPRLLGISKRGNRYLRMLLIHGARTALPRLAVNGELYRW